MRDTQVAVIDHKHSPFTNRAGVASYAEDVLSFLWVRGVHILGPNRCSLFMYLLPVLTALAAIVLLAGPVRAYHVTGGGIALAGVACAEIFRRPLRRSPSVTPEVVK